MQLTKSRRFQLSGVGQAIEGVDNFEYPSRYAKREIDEIFTRPIYRELISSRYMQRLRSISFLGAIDYAMFSGRQVSKSWRNRFHHSIAVAHLSLTYATEARLSTRDEITAVVAALLHDIGHFPLSHSFEPVIKRRLGFGHHDLLIDFLRGKKLGAESLREIIYRHDIDPEVIEQTVSGTASSKMLWFDGSITFDTLEGITRCNKYLGARSWKLTSEVVHTMADCKADAMGFLDDFWLLKDAVYSQLIQSRVGLESDAVASAAVENMDVHSLQDLVTKDDPTLFALCPELFERLRNVSSGGSTQSSYAGPARMRRVFEIDRGAIGSFPSVVNSRYIQRKE